MDTMVNGELSRILLLLGLGVTSISALLYRLIIKIRGSFKPYKETTLLYLFLSLLLFAIIGCTAHWAELKYHFYFYLFYQFYFLLLGIIHIYCMQHYLEWNSDSKGMWLELLFTFTTAILGGAGFVTIYRLFNREGLEFEMLTSTIFFVIPWFTYQTFKKAAAIPPKVLKQWFYPIQEELKEPDERKLKNLLVISFEFQKQNTDIYCTNFRAKAPVDMELGELFYYFINDYNERHPNSRIQYATEMGDAYGWIFYKKPRWYTIMTKYVDIDKTIFKNHIRENDIIICTRSLN